MKLSFVAGSFTLLTCNILAILPMSLAVPKALDKRMTTPRLPYGGMVLNSTLLPLTLSSKTDLDSDGRSSDTIRNKLALYAFLVDSEESNLDLLDNIFDKNAAANYSTSAGILKPLTKISESLSSAMSKISISQTSLSSQFIMFMDDHNAFSVSYFQNVQWGVGDYIDQSLQTRGQYQDSWFRNNPNSQDWKIVFRNKVYMTPAVGNSSILS